MAAPPNGATTDCAFIAATIFGKPRALPGMRFGFHGGNRISVLNGRPPIPAIIHAVADRPVSSLVLAELYDSSDTSFLNLILQQRGNLKPLLGLIETMEERCPALGTAVEIRVLRRGSNRRGKAGSYSNGYSNRRGTIGMTRLMGAFIVAIGSIDPKKTSEEIIVMPRHF